MGYSRKELRRPLATSFNGDLPLSFAGFCDAHELEFTHDLQIVGIDDTGSLVSRLLPNVRMDGFDQWPAMSPERYAALELSSGVRIIKQGDVYWRRVRPFFYRPLFPFCKYDSVSINRSFRKFAACQYAVWEGQPSNSFLNLLIYNDVRSYDAEKLRRGPAKNLAFAIEHGLQVRRLFDDRDFCVQGYRAYLSFYNRTKYRFANHRTDRQGFEHWTKTLFRFPELVVLGAFLGPSLVGFGIACAVEGTVIMKTAVHSDLGLELRSPDLLLHLWRLAARNDSNAKMIYDSAMTTPGIDEFKRRRGAVVTALPAHLRASPLLLKTIRRLDKTRYDRLLGSEKIRTPFL